MFFPFQFFLDGFIFRQFSVAELFSFVAGSGFDILNTHCYNESRWPIKKRWRHIATDEPDVVGKLMVEMKPRRGMQDHNISKPGRGIRETRQRNLFGKWGEQFSRKIFVFWFGKWNNYSYFVHNERNLAAFFNDLKTNYHFPCFHIRFLGSTSMTLTVSALWKSPPLMLLRLECKRELDSATCKAGSGTWNRWNVER